MFGGTMESFYSLWFQLTDVVATDIYLSQTQEPPLCSVCDCQSLALEVDPYFPYLDDQNRCSHHRKPQN